MFILCLLLFCIYINDLTTINNILNFILYADDTTIYYNIEYFPSDNIANHVTIELDQIYAWLKHNKLSLNVESSKFMTFHTNKKNPLNCYNSL